MATTLPRASNPSVTGSREVITTGTSVPPAGDSPQAQPTTNLPRLAIATGVGAGAGAALGHATKMHMGKTAAAGGALGMLAAIAYEKVYIAGLVDDEPPPPGSGSRGTEELPIAPDAVTEAYTIPPYLMDPPTVWQGPTPGLSRETVTAKVRVVPCKCRIRYDKKAYAGTKLAAYYNNGSLVSMERGNDIIRWDAINGPPTYVVKNKLREYRDFWYRRVDNWDNYDTFKKLPYPILADWGAVENMLSALGFTKVDVSQGSNSYQDIRLPLGTYVFVAQPPSTGAGATWSYISGYWQWTKKGPRTFSKNKALDRLQDGKCTSHVTKFKIIPSVSSFEDISQEVKAKSGGSPTVDLQPIVNLWISKKRHVENSYGKAFYAACWGLRTLDKVAGGLLNKALDIVQKYLI